MSNHGLVQETIDIIHFNWNAVSVITVSPPRLEFGRVLEWSIRNMGDSPLPDFRDPPVVETVLSVQFAPIEGMGVPHFGLFWDKVRKDFPRYEVHAPIESEIESFDPPKPTQESGIKIVVAPDTVWLWFIAKDDQRLLQIQNGRFIFNWRKRGTDNPYPKYNQFVRPSFEKYWKTFTSFLSCDGLQEPKAVQCEVTYVNHIPKGKGWEDVGDWSKIFNFLSFSGEASILPIPEAGQIDLTYLMSEESGRLRAKIRRAIRRDDNSEVIAFNLTARGRPKSSSLDGILDWFDVGHEWCVRGFTDLTTEEMHCLWGRLT